MRKCYARIFHEPNKNFSINQYIKLAKERGVTPTQLIYEIFKDEIEPEFIFSWQHAEEKILKVIDKQNKNGGFNGF